MYCIYIIFLLPSPYSQYIWWFVLAFKDILELNNFCILHLESNSWLLKENIKIHMIPLLQSIFNSISPPTPEAHKEAFIIQFKVDTVTILFVTPFTKIVQINAFTTLSKVLFLFPLSTNQSGSIEGRNGRSAQAPALHSRGRRGQLQVSPPTFQTLPKAAHFPPQYENIHLCHSAAMHLVCFFKKRKKNQQYVSLPLKFQERKMKGHFVFKHWYVAV